MKKIILIMPLFVFAFCSPKNPYYKNHLSDLAYNVFFEAKQESHTYNIYGASDTSNVLKYLLPDTIKGEFDSGNCVAEIQLHGTTNQIININFIGMTLFRKKTNIITGFDRYAVTSRRINYKIEPQFDEYIQFTKSMIEKIKFVNIGSSKGIDGRAYLKIIFYKNNI